MKTPRLLRRGTEVSIVAQRRAAAGDLANRGGRLQAARDRFRLTMSLY